MTIGTHITFAKALFVGALVFIFASCQNNMQEVNALTVKNDSAQMIGLDVELTRSIKGFINVRMKAKKVRQLNAEDNVFEFPEGIEMEMYDTLGHITSQMSAEYSTYNDKDGIWEAKNNVDVSNDKGDRLNTEYLVWDRGKGTIETNQFVKITSKDGVIYGDGLVSDQNFDNWEVINGRGVFDVENE